MRNLYVLPSDLPVPTDDGRANHLRGAKFPSLELSATNGKNYRLDEALKNPTVMFVYPRSGDPKHPASPEWDEIPGARGCTPQACSYKKEFSFFDSLSIQLFGLSVQSTEYQNEFVSRNELPFPILSDQSLELTQRMEFPTFEFNGLILIQRMVLFIREAQIEDFIYPVFPPKNSAQLSVEWIKSHWSDLLS